MKIPKGAGGGIFDRILFGHTCVGNSLSIPKRPKMGRPDRASGNSVTPTRESAGLTPLSGPRMGALAVRNGYRWVTDLRGSGEST
ncbi:hypothetical protein ACVWZ4_005467 [Bradyrhizobium sp. USDA 4472]